MPLGMRQTYERSGSVRALGQMRDREAGTTTKGQDLTITSHWFWHFLEPARNSAARSNKSTELLHVDRKRTLKKAKGWRDPQLGCQTTDDESPPRMGQHLECELRFN